MITLIHVSTLKETLGSQSENNTSLVLINGSDIKYANEKIEEKTEIHNIYKGLRD
ncbi:hypothetical protein BH18THE1_BH18THE1_05190 [soil metagenome]